MPPKNCSKSALQNNFTKMLTNMLSSKSKRNSKPSFMVTGHWAGRKWFDILIKHCLFSHLLHRCRSRLDRTWNALYVQHFIYRTGTAVKHEIWYGACKVQQNIVKSRMAAHKSPQLSSFSSCSKLSAKLQILRCVNCSSDAMWDGWCKQGLPYHPILRQ